MTLAMYSKINGDKTDNTDKNSKINGNNNGSHDTLFVKYLKVVGAVSLYWFVSICMVFLNKYLLKVIYAMFLHL